MVIRSFIRSYTHTRTHMHKWTYARMQTHTHAHTQTHTHTQEHAQMRTQVRIRKYARTRTHKHKRTDGWTHTHTHSQTPLFLSPSFLPPLTQTPTRTFPSVADRLFHGNVQCNTVQVPYTLGTQSIIHTKQPMHRHLRQSLLRIWCSTKNTYCFWYHTFLQFKQQSFS